MTTTSEELKESAEWLRELANTSHANFLIERFDTLAEQEEYEDERDKRLNHIANMVDMLSIVSFTPSLLLEKKVEGVLAKVVEAIVEGDNIETADAQLAMLWLINQDAKSNASKALLGQGLAGLGAGAAASILGSLGKSMGKAPVDPDDNGDE